MGNRSAKLTLPDISGAIPRRGAALEATATHKLTLITAGPGYGKTVFAAQAAAMTGMDLVWFRTDASDRDLPGFLRLLAGALAGYYPGFDPSRVLDIHSVTGEGGTDIDALAWDYLDLVAASLTRDLVLVMDDSHLLDRSRDILSFFQVALDRFIPGFRIILSGRTVPGLKISRLMARRQVARVTEQDLAFSPEEVARLYSRVFGLDLPWDQIEDLREKTRGWPGGLVLFYQSLGQRTGPEIKAAISRLKGSHRLIADYMKENVYDSMPRPLQVFMLKTSILNQLDAAFCSLYLEREDARKVLCTLEDRHCFVFSANEDRNRFYYHPLFREFLRDRIRDELGAGQPGRLFARAARLYEKKDQGQEALIHHIQAGNMDDASRLANRFARPMIKQDRPHMLKSLLSVIPSQYMDDEPWFQYLQAGYYGLCSQLRTAVKAYEKVLRVFRSQKDEQGECLVLMELAEYYLADGDLKQAEQAYTKILVKDKLDAYLTVLVMGYLIRILALAGRPQDADRYARKAVALVDTLDKDEELKMGRAWIDVARGFRSVYSGGYEKAMALGEDAKSLFGAVGEHRCLFSTYFLISYACFYLGRFTKGVAAAREGIHLARDKGISDEFAEFLVLLRAKNSLEMDQVSSEEVDRALEDVEKSLAAFEARSFPEGTAQAYLVLHRAWMRKGEVRRAEQSLRKGMAAIREKDIPLVRNELSVALSALLLFDREQPRKQEAFTLLKGAEQELLYSGWHMSMISRIFARYYWAHGHRETAYKYMVYALKIAEEESYDAWVAGEAAHILPLLVSMFSMGSMSSYIGSLFRQMTPAVGQGLFMLQAGSSPKIRKAAASLGALVPRPDPVPLSAFFFGRFRVFVGKREILPEHWKSRKALTLFKYLLARGEKGFMDRDILMELAWPEEDPRKSAQRFHVAMASIRRTLEPDINRGVRSSYIRRSGQAYRIALGKEGRVDIRDFKQMVASAGAEPDPESAHARYQKAVALYKGPFLREDPYEDWCARMREEYEQVYLSVLNRIMDFHERNREYSLCISTAMTYLNHDRLAERVVRKLMEYHACTGNILMVSRLYKNFSQDIQEELDCGVSEETRVLYRRLVSGA